VCVAKLCRSVCEVTYLVQPSERTQAEGLVLRAGRDVALAGEVREEGGHLDGPRSRGWRKPSGVLQKRM
jgi:hypothetical protein